jgi:ABC-2 type transport system ATP-binding protein
MSIIRVEHLSHRYSSTWAIEDINFEINNTGVVGLLGSNGAGKSTTMNIMCGVLSQTRGNVYVGGINLDENPIPAKKKIGFLPQNAPLHHDLTVQEYLLYCGHLRSIENKKMRSAVEMAKRHCGIADFSHRLIKNLSGGYRQRVGLAQAILHEPELVVLDEPTNGLDPNQIIEIRHLIKEIAEQRAVIFSSHILSEVQLTCNEVKMIERGRLVFSDTMEAFNNYIQPNILLLTLASNPPAVELSTVPGILRVEKLFEKHYRVHFSGAVEVAEEIVQRSVEKNWRLQEITLQKSSLEEVFAQLAKNN